MPTKANPKKFASDFWFNDCISIFNTVVVSEYADERPTFGAYGFVRNVIVGALKGPSL